MAWDALYGKVTSRFPEVEFVTMAHYGDFVKNEQAFANEYAFDVTYPNGHKTTLIRPSMTSEKMGVPAFVRGPMTGEQTETILAELGYSPKQIKEMEETGAAYQIKN